MKHNSRTIEKRIRFTTILHVISWTCAGLFAEMLEPRSKGARPQGENKVGTGRETLRLRSKGPATVEEMVRTSFYLYSDSRKNNQYKRALKMNHSYSYDIMQILHSALFYLIYCLT